MKTIFTEEQTNFIKENYETKTYSEIADKLGFTERQIRGKANNMGLTKVRKINDDYFNIIDTPLKSYLLGFIFADGWVIYNEQTRNYELGISIQKQDDYILKILNIELGNQNIIKYFDEKDVIINGIETHRGEMACLRVYSKNIVLALIEKGVTPNKTQSDICPQLDTDYFFDFLRGYIDGDGCFYKNKNSINMHITCASNVILERICNYLKLYNINTYVYKEKERKYRLVCCDFKSMNLLVNHLYYTDDLFCLKRKYEKIKSYIGSAI